ncbi:hypothetical protein TSO221_19530 [Azospirillum sp. TSO22-1]|nr:hypothetical protein TSO221_19530 [Azospirillum sp. TSO22-1]
MMIRRLAVMLAVLWALPAWAADGAFYVAPTGGDGGSGHADSPFATLKRAVEAARKAGVKSIVVRGGHYRMEQTLTLAAEDEGLRIAAAPGETPVFSGAERVEGFKPEAGGVFAAPLGREPGLDVTLAGTRLQAARSGDYTPDDPIRSGWAVATAVKGGGDKRRFRFTPGAVDPKWAQPGVRVQTLDRERLADDIAGIRQIDAASHTLTLDADAWYPLRDGATFRLLGHPDFLKFPGQFAWRARDKRLLLLPPDAGAFGREPAVLVARLAPLLRLAGTSAVTLEGLAFEDVPYSGPAVLIDGGGRHRIVGNRFANVGKALELNGSSDNEVRGNRMEHLGRSGVEVKPGSAGNRIVANTIDGVGEVALFSAGVSLSGVTDTVVGHNDIRRSARYGISLKNWNPETVNTGTVIEYNRIRDTGRETADAGAIETLGRSDTDTRTIIRYNDIRETGGLATDAAGRWLERYKGFGIYLDDLTNGVLVEGNFLMDTGWASVFIHGGDNNRVENNIAVLTRPNDRFLRLEWVPKAGVAGFLKDNAITQNVIHLRAPVKDIVESHTGGQPVLNANVIDRPGSGAAPRPPATARSQQGPRLANPYFVDPANDDFRLRPDGQARELGIEDLPWSRIGPAGYPGR